MGPEQRHPRFGGLRNGCSKGEAGRVQGAYQRYTGTSGNGMNWKQTPIDGYAGHNEFRAEEQRRNR